jgi:hypothetical protein
VTQPSPNSFESRLPDAFWSVERHFLDFLCWQFSQLPAGVYQWRDDEQSSDIHISGDTPLNPVTIGKRPAVTCKRGDIGFAGLGIGDVVFNDLHTGAMSYMDMSSTVVMIHVLSRIDYEADKLAHVIAHWIRAYRRPLVKNSGGNILSVGQRINISAPSPPGALISEVANESEWSRSTVAVPVFMQRIDHIHPLNRPTFEGILTTVRSRTPTDAPTSGTDPYNMPSRPRRDGS